MDLLLNIIKLVFHFLDKQSVETVLMRQDIIVDNYLLQELKLYKSEHLGLFGNPLDKSIIIQARGSAGKMPQAIGTLTGQKKLYRELLSGNLKAWVHSVNANGVTIEFKFVKI